MCLPPHATLLAGHSQCLRSNTSNSHVAPERSRVTAETPRLCAERSRFGAGRSHAAAEWSRVRGHVGGG
eukprot:2000566-Rhodomonas_salina.1